MACQVATKEILRFEALWLKHFKDTRGEILKEIRSETLGKDLRWGQNHELWCKVLHSVKE